MAERDARRGELRRKRMPQVMKAEPAHARAGARLRERPVEIVERERPGLRRREDPRARARKPGKRLRQRLRERHHARLAALRRSFDAARLGAADGDDPAL